MNASKKIFDSSNWVHTPQLCCDLKHSLRLKNTPELCSDWDFLFLELGSYPAALLRLETQFEVKKYPGALLRLGFFIFCVSELLTNDKSVISSKINRKQFNYA
jgi:hypothetical protein